MVPEIDPSLNTGDQLGIVMPMREGTPAVLVQPFRDRMTVVDKVYHQPKTGEAFCCETTFEQWLDSEESVYSRRRKVGAEWQLLDLGWFREESKPVGMLVVRNDEGKHLQRLPTEEQKAEIRTKTLEVGVLVPEDRLRSVAAEVLQLVCVGPATTGPLADSVLDVFRRQLGQGTVVLRVSPGTSSRCVPAETDLYVRCLGGDCHYTVFAFPG